MQAARRLDARLREHFPDRPAPIGLARIDALPDGVCAWEGPSPSACSLWRRASERVLAAGADHGACPIGRVTQGFARELPPDDPMVATMLAVDYIDPAEVPLLPALPEGHAGIVYGPLGALPVEPEAALVLATPAQAMLLGEALGVMTAGTGGLAVGGRPTCTAIPAAILDASPHGSLGCASARVYAGLDPDEMLVVIPSDRLGGLAEHLDHVVDANRAVAGAAEQAVAASSAAEEQRTQR